MRSTHLPPSATGRPGAYVTPPAPHHWLAFTAHPPLSPQRAFRLLGLSFYSILGVLVRSRSLTARRRFPLPSRRQCAGAPHPPPGPARRRTPFLPMPMVPHTNKRRRKRWDGKSFIRLCFQPWARGSCPPGARVTVRPRHPPPRRRRPPRRGPGYRGSGAEAPRPAGARPPPPPRGAVAVAETRPRGPAPGARGAAPARPLHPPRPLPLRPARPRPGRRPRPPPVPSLPRGYR